MFFKCFIYLFLYCNLMKIYESIECIDFQCFDGGHERNNNCFPCTNVSFIARKHWLNHLENMILIHRKLKNTELALQVEVKISQGMYCCNFDQNVGKIETCSLNFSPGSKDGIPHYGMGCDGRNFWLQSTCLNAKVESRCCRSNHCNYPDSDDLKHMMDQAGIIFPRVVETGNPKIVIVCMALLIGVSVVVIIAIVSFKVARRKYLSKKYPQTTDLPHHSFYHKLLCFNKLFSIVRSFRRRSSCNLPSDRDDNKDYRDNLISPFYRPFNGMKIENSFQLSCSGSGFGMPVMTRRTAATDISLIQAVGEGRFGTVWLGKWNGDNVAVKIFSSRDEVSWAREKDMYQQNFLRHSNVLGFVTTDRRDNGLATELWLVTDYHENGSLFEYLRAHIISIEQAVKMTRSITNGLAYLHTEINGLDGKPGIAHRDLKSRNILVKSCGECCIGDLGLAVRLIEDCSTLDLNNVGTRRYMAPEIILDKIVQPDMIYNGGLEAFKKADIYSYSLVIWEILRRCECSSLNISASAYEMPYQNLVSNDPSIEEMKSIICDRKIRPPINSSWDNLNPLKDISKSVRESWFEEPASRLNIMRLKKIMNNAWNEISTLKNQITDLTSCGDFVSNDSAINDTTSYHCKSPFSNTTISTEFPSSLTSNDIIPNIVIKSKDVFSNDSYCLGVMNQM